MTPKGLVLNAQMRIVGLSKAAQKVAHPARREWLANLQQDVFIEPVSFDADRNRVQCRYTNQNGEMVAIEHFNSLLEAEGILLKLGRLGWIWKPNLTKPHRSA